jgi:hypothetical protein
MTKRLSGAADPRPDHASEFSCAGDLSQAKLAVTDAWPERGAQIVRDVRPNQMTGQPEPGPT